MISPTEYRRRLVLAAAIAVAIAVIALAATFVKPARAEPPSASECLSVSAMLQQFWPNAEGLIVIGTPDDAQRLSDAMSKRFKTVGFTVVRVLAFEEPPLVEIIGFDASGCVARGAGGAYAIGHVPVAEFAEIMTVAGIAMPPMQAVPDAPDKRAPAPKTDPGAI